MPHNIALITTIATGLGLAMILGFIAVRLRMPPLVGYLVAGIIAAPTTPGIVADVGLASQLAEIGVMLLMFGVGLHFSIADLLSVKRIAIPGALVQILLATLLGAGAGIYWDLSFGEALVFGLALSVASTVVLLKALEARGIIDSINGRIAVGWLVVEDLVMVLVLVLLPPLAGLLGGHSAVDTHGASDPSLATTNSLTTTIFITLGKVAAFIAFMLIVGKRVLPKLLWAVAGTGSRELFSLCVIATAVGVAYGSAMLFDVSFALGAFFAGMMLRESEFSHRAADDSLPLRDAFAVLFFVSVGMLFDPRILIDEPLKVLAVIGIIMFGKTLVAVALVLAFRYPLNTALIVGASLAQIGEFSFILAGLSIDLGLMDTKTQNLILAGALASIALNSLLFAAIAPLQRWFSKDPERARSMAKRTDPLAVLPATVDDKFLSGQVVLVGYGRVGRRIAQTLTEHKIPFVVAETNREVVEQLRAQHIPAVCGDAADANVLIQAHITNASLLIAATSNTFHVRNMIEIARKLNPTIETVIRTHNEEEATLWKQEKIGKIFLSEKQLADGMAEYVLERMGKTEHH